jgi:hypothetical protein
VETTIDSGLDDVRSWKSMALGPAGEVYVAYYDTTNKDLRAAGASTFTLELIASAGDVGQAPAVTVDPSGKAVVGFVDATAQKYRVATRGASGFTIEDAASNVFVGYRGMSQLLFDGAGKLHVVFGDHQDDQTQFTQPAVRYGFRSGTTWTVNDIAPTAMVARRSLSFTPTGKPYVLFQSTSLGNRLWIEGVLPTESLASTNGFQYTPVAAYDWLGNDLKVQLNNAGNRVVKQNGTWFQTSTSLPNDYFVDGVRGPDGKMRFLTQSWKIVTLPSCEPSCTGRSCGTNGCGGTCAPGCSGAQMCSPWGQCQ